MLTDLITSADASTRDQALAEACQALSLEELLAEARELDHFRRHEDNLYQRVRALFFLYALHRFHLPPKMTGRAVGRIPFAGHEHLLDRRFQEAIDTFLAAQERAGPGDALSSALASAYHQLAFQTLADQVRKSVRTVRGNQWMFRMGHPADHPLRLKRELLDDSAGSFPLLLERTPVRMDLTHSAWSDIFFLGMDFPEGAKVINVSIDLGVHGRDAETAPPVEAYLRVIDEPVIRLTSIDLKATARIDNLGEIFDFAKDHLGLLKAAVIAAGIVPPGIEGSGQKLSHLLEKLLGPGKGLELVSSVNNIPKGSRLAVSTNLLAALIGVLMRATGQTESLTGPLQENERRLILARAILGEWIGGSGGGWQDSGGVWPGIKLISGEEAGPTDPEHGISRGRLMPKHHVFDEEEIPASARQALQDSLVLVHGGMAQNVGPILEMVSEKYLLRSSKEWQARQEALTLLDELINALKAGDIQALGKATTRNFYGPLQTIIPWATNLFTDTLIARAFQHFGDDFWGFWMLGGMSGGGMGFIFAPHRKKEAQEKMAEIMLAEKQRLEKALPFAMDPVVYDFAINPHGTVAQLLSAPGERLFPPNYYQVHVPQLLAREQSKLTPLQRQDLLAYRDASLQNPRFEGSIHQLFDSVLPKNASGSAQGPDSLDHLLKENGFDSKLHEAIREDLQRGRLGLAQNRLPASTDLRDVTADDVIDTTAGLAEESRRLGEEALRQGEVAVVTLAAGAGSRWTGGAGTCKALNPFAPLKGSFRTFLEVHLAKSRKVGEEAGTPLPHLFTTSYLTHEPTAAFLKAVDNYRYPGPLLLSRGQSVGLRMIPTERDLRFAWEETAQQRLDEQQEKVRESARSALINWARTAGEASDYTDNLPLQCLHPVGHFFEVPNLILNGTLRRLLQERPQLRTLMLHNIDTLGAQVDPELLGRHRQSGQGFTFEVINRRLEDRGGGLARVNGLPRLVEGLAMPNDEAEFDLTYYNTLTTWIELDELLQLIDLTREDILQDKKGKIQNALRQLARRLPTYITLKEVKKRWGHGQEDVFPVAQFEKLWGDLSTLPEAKVGYFVVPRLRGQQLKDPAQLDGWLRDGSAQYIESLCRW
ncbi:UTP--glucose-1-phosphate uridylyltransferase [Roseibacillus ishigakijimensis]|uniref:UTP--glucose-1-phosphate uridylyltransferase n=1 Tax=Roseibacillus ishigakijimensis TaxID=454146 RepID=A0A934RPX0_9BACT|nr:UTP--glucose-1-phosphate uridylyltransferase [Roseibacillus ishigakijimensis]MBK1833308.1 UTP--glucose-1-phosphate uridylyltransferase [Roseibacillus ishigakijimensis]